MVSNWQLSQVDWEDKAGSLRLGEVAEEEAVEAKILVALLHFGQVGLGHCYTSAAAVAVAVGELWQLDTGDGVYLQMALDPTTVFVQEPFVQKPT